ncbi:MAG: glycosyltransferase family 2 protein [Acidobacteria bacterium]|nr:glycosyltransferase family 2 protein [Acidobacteriota bacterium]
MKPASVSVTIVTYNSRRFIKPCLEWLFLQHYEPLEILVVDNASVDGTLEVLEAYRDRVRLIPNARNVGFAEGQNQAIRASRGDWVLTLNPDVLLLPGFLENLVEAGQIDAKAGAVCGKLLSIEPDLRFPADPRLDSAGICFTPSLRHFDRGWHEPDDGRFERREYVFGATAAAALYRRDMIADISSQDGFFDPDFFAYREDADVAWRAQVLGWRCLYVPESVGYHVRSVRPGNRRGVPPILNMHSVKNRFLMRVKNVTGDLYRRHWLAITARDLLVVGGCLLWEPTSLPAFWKLAKCLRGALHKRRQIMSRRRSSDEYLAGWIGALPQALPPGRLDEVLTPPL